MRKPKIFIACDTKDLKKVKKIISQSQTNKIKIGYKFGLEFLNSKNGRQFVSKLKNKIIFADLKLSDVPNTMLSAVKTLKDLKLNYLTVHISSGLTALRAVKKVSGSIKILGVSTLTSLNDKDLKLIGYGRSVKNLVAHQAKLARRAKLDGIICSGQEAKLLKKICKGMEIITPGIRLRGDSIGDQKRVMLPKDAFKNGATAIVMGRSITKGNIKNNIQKLIKSL